MDTTPTFQNFKEVQERSQEEIQSFLRDNSQLDAFIAMTANECLHQASQQVDPVALWSTLWYENEVSCLFADTNVGKSIYAVQIADCIAQQGKRVLYFDFEMSMKQFQRRYTDEQGQLHHFSDNFIRLEMKQDVNVANLDSMLTFIEFACIKENARIIILDNITWICNSSETGDVAGYLMQQLIAMKRRLNLSILVLAHTPKRATASALTQNSLAGSKRLANFMDSIFAIGIDHTNPAVGRYIKQIKVRSAEMLYGEENVIRAELAKEGAMLQFHTIGFATEKSLLSSPDDSKDDPLELEIISDCLKQGMTVRQIASELHIPNTTVHRRIRQIKAQQNL